MRWAISIACIVFLIYKLLQINSSEVLYKQFQNISAQKYLFLAFAVILLPLNLFCESIKWKMLLKNVVRINFRQSFRAVLWGQTGAFFTPNSLGEFPVRVLNLPSQYRLSAITMGLAGSFAQTVAVSVLGIVAAAFFLTQNNLLNNFNNRNILLLVAITISLSIFFLYFLLPKIGKKFKQTKFKIIKRIAVLLENFVFCQSLKILLISIVKYLIFSIQFYSVLRFCSIDFSPVEAITAMPTFYLLITFTPLINAAEAAVRSSIGILVFGVFSQNYTAIIAASIIFWLLNFCIPAIFGVLYGFKKQEKYA